MVISKEVTAGITHFDSARKTALVSDFSGQGVGFLMLQKYCLCGGLVTPACCRDRWQIWMVDSRFCSQAEFNYEVTAGELIAVVHALQKSKDYMLGILGNVELEKIDNLRLRQLKEKKLCWRFRAIYLPGKGKEIGGADTLSRMRLDPLSGSLEHAGLCGGGDGCGGAYLS